MTDSLLEHKHNFWKSAPKKWLKFAGSSVLVTAIFFLISFIVIQLFSQKVELEAFRTIGQVLMLVSLLFTYFLIVGFALINVGSWKDFFKKMYHIAITKIHYLLLLILIMGVIYALIFYLIFLIMFSFPQLFVLVTLLLIILVVFMAISRIFWVACIKDFSENK